MKAQADPQFRLSLRSRLFLGMLMVVLVVTSGFALAMYEFVEVLEEELLHRTLTRELDGLVIDYKAGAAVAGTRGVSDRVFVTKPGAPAKDLPDALETLGARETAVIQHNGVEFYAGRRDVRGARVYLMLSVGTVEALERRLSVIGWITFAGALLVALLISLLFARLILSPVRDLAHRVSGLQPADPGHPIAADYNDQAMRAIAESFDELVDRFQAYAQREQAFTQDASHELRTPLAVTLSTTELLLEDPDLNSRTRERVERIHNAGQRMQRLVSALLFLAREQPRQNKRCDIAAILADILPFYEDSLNKKNIHLDADTAPAYTDAPPGMVDCILHNLIENAVEHTADGRIEVRTNPNCILIRDTGSGIDANTLQRIYERRYHTRKSSGLGIGLYLVQRICMDLDWRIEISSRPGQGTRIEIRLSQP